MVQGNALPTTVNVSTAKPAPSAATTGPVAVDVRVAPPVSQVHVSLVKPLHVTRIQMAMVKQRLRVSRLVDRLAQLILEIKMITIALPTTPLLGETIRVG
jgi:hypothetical protein